MPEHNVIHNQKGQISSWLGIIILVIIAIIVWAILFTYSGPKMDITTSTPATQISKVTPLFAYSGQVIEITSDKIVIQPDTMQTSADQINGLIDGQTTFVRKGVPKVNPEGEKSGRLFRRENINFTDIQIGDQVLLKSHPNQPINNLVTFKVQTVEVRYVY